MKKLIKNFTTENERIILVTLSYIIGFTAAYIAFGMLNQTIDIPEQSAAVAKTSLTVNIPKDNEVTSDTSNIITDVLYDNGLYAVVNGELKVISAPLAYGSGVGFHDRIGSYNIISGGKEVRFCSYATADTDTCTTYIYNAVDHTLHAE